MNSVKNTLDRIFGAVSFAEADCREHALDYLKSQPIDAEKASILQWIHRTWKPRMENLFNAVAFAEGGCPELAEELMGQRKRGYRKESLQDFLDNIGLGNVPVYYGVANL
mgnify:CR=1 FL=1